MKRIQPELVPLLLAAFLAPIIGGQVSLDAVPLQDGYLSGLLGGSELPFGARAILGSLVALSLAIALVRRRVIQIPSLTIAGQVVVLVGIVGLSILSSEFGYLSYSSWLSWVVFGLCLFATVATVGRRVGVRALTWAMVLGGTVTALKGIQEYANLRAGEPGHRIFADWINPNALAGMLGILVPLALGLFLTSERIEALGSALCAGVMLFALALTQSKGGLLTTGMAVAVMSVAGIAWRGRAKVALVLVPVALAGLLVFGTMATAKTPGGGFLQRVASSEGSQDQSSGFRILLWKGAVSMVKSKPTGYGVGTYRFESARPGLTEQTFHAHQTWLQLAVEASPLATLALLALAGSWTLALFSGARKWPWEDAGLRAGVLGACVAAAADGFLESNLIYTGIGMVLFMVMGIGLQTSTDGSMPEHTPKNLRWILVGIGCALPTLLLWHTAIVETDKVAALTAQISGDLPGARAALDNAKSLAPGDGEALYLDSRYQQGSENLATLRKVVSYAPTTRYLRALSRALFASGQKVQAISTLDRALERDPNNLPALELKYQEQLDDENLPGALSTAERLVAVEDTVYFRTRAIPEIVPLETYDARVFLASHTVDHSKKVQLLQGAVNGYLAYFERTLPVIKQNTNDQRPDFLGHSMKEAADVASRAKSAATELIRLYRESGDTASAGKVSESEARFTTD